MATSINVGVNRLRAVLSAVVLVTSSSTHALKMDKVSSESSEGTSVIRSRRSNAGVHLARERFEENYWNSEETREKIVLKPPAARPLPR